MGPYDNSILRDRQLVFDVTVEFDIRVSICRWPFSVRQRVSHNTKCFVGVGLCDEIFKIRYCLFLLFSNELYIVLCNFGCTTVCVMDVVWVSRHVVSWVSVSGLIRQRHVVGN